MPHDSLRPPAPSARASARVSDERPQIDFDSYLPFELTSIANKIARSASRTYLRRFGVGINEWRIISNLRVRPGATANILCQRSALDKAAVSRSLKLLEDAGMVEIDKEVGDARARTLRLTAKGDELHDRMIAVALHREAGLLTGFTQEERTLLLSMIRRLHANMPLIQKDEAGED